MPKTRTTILIDGSNFYFKLKELKLHNLLKFNFAEFAKDLAGKDQIIATNYYVGAVKTDGTPAMQKNFDNQRKLLSHLKKQKINYTLGYLLKTDGKLHEKGVDVRIAVDILVTAYEKTADRIILISSDTDLEPAIKKAREKNILIEYIGFKHQPSIAMKRFCNKYKLLEKKNLKKYITSESTTKDA
ncbi:MAG: hypothetical protein QG609_608 [Patescibacteria group bacterium]|nr:hypothetical protein [Patescibacteria group bacterium]